MDPRPRVNLELEIKESALAIRWPLFNQGCMALIEMEQVGTSVEPDISYQIKNIPEIRVKNLLGERTVLRWFRALNHWLTRILVAFLASVFIALVPSGDGSDVSWASPMMVLTVLLLQYAGWSCLLFIRVKRNPYSKLIAAR